MVSLLVQKFSVSTPTLLVIGTYFSLIIATCALLFWKYRPRTDFIRKLTSISDPIRKQLRRYDDQTERAKILERVAVSSSVKQNASPKKLILSLMLGVKNKVILAKVLMINFSFVLLMTFGLKAGSFLVIVLSSFVFLMTTQWLVKKDRQRKIRQVVEQMPMAVDLLVRSLEAGLNVNHAFMMCATQLDEPIRTEFFLIQREMIAGITVPEAVESFYERIPDPSVAFFFALISAQSKSGGPLAGGLSVLSDTLRSRRSIQNKLQALTAEPRTSMKVLLAIPAVFTVISFFAQPDKMVKLFTTSEGQLYLVPMLAWSLIGVYVMLKMTEIRD